jgi:hypothetical protein
LPKDTGGDQERKGRKADLEGEEWGTLEYDDRSAEGSALNGGLESIHGRSGDECSELIPDDKRARGPSGIVRRDNRIKL